jgi:hypothetical protein
LKSPRFTPLRAAMTLSVLALVALLAGCGGGGGGSSQGAKDTIKKAFGTSIKSADVNLQFTAKVDGVAQLQQPVQLKLAGPFQSNGKGKLPNLNWQASVSGGGQSFSGGLVSTGNNAYVSFQGSNYEVGTASIAKINQQLGTSTQNKSLKDFGIDPVNWVTNAQTKGDENVNGANTTHVQAGLDIAKMLTDLNKVVAQAGGAMGSTTAQRITPQQIDQIKQVVKDPKFDIYVSKDDNTLRRMNVSVDFQIPSSQKSQFQGATGGNVTFSLDFTKVGEQKTITAPPNPKPISQLQGALGGLTGSSGGSGSGGSGTVPPAAGSNSGGSGSTPSAAQFNKYSKCIEKANPSNPGAIQKCAALLK